MVVPAAQAALRVAVLAAMVLHAAAGTDLAGRVALVSDVSVHGAGERRVCAQRASRNNSPSSNEQVTGSSGGIGKEIAREMHQRGCDVIISGRDMARSSLSEKQSS